MKTTLFLAITAALIICAFAEEEKEQKIKLSEVPAPAAKAIQELSGGEKIQSLSKETEDGKTVYEAKIKKEGRVREVTVDAAGTLISEEEVIALSEAPEAVQKAVKEAAAGGKINKLERINEDGKVTFEALISSKEKREEIVISSKGKIVEREDKTAEKDND